jgi:hypothetical protein
LAPTYGEGNLHVRGSAAQMINDWRRHGAAPEFTSCGALSVDTEPVDLTHDRRLYKESSSGRSKPSKRWRMESTAPLTASAGLSALQGRSARWAPCEDESPTDPLGQGEPSIASSGILLTRSYLRPLRRCLSGGETCTDPQGGYPRGCRLSSGGSGPKSVGGSSWMNLELDENGKDTMVFRLV